MGKKVVIYLILLGYFPGFTWGESAIGEDSYQISRRWYQGKHLIYDCSNRHFACVNQNSYVDCEEEYQKNIERKKSEAGCVFIKVFKDQDSCFEKQSRLVEKAKPVPFCFLKN